MESLDLKCEIEKSEWHHADKFEQCTVKNIKVTTKNESIKSVNGSIKPMSPKSLWIDHQTVYYLPKGVDKFFPNLEMLTVYDTELKSLTQDDLKSLTHLMFIYLNHNDIEYLDNDLFKFNLKLKTVSLSENKLKYIGANLLSNLKGLQVVNFQFNPCINVRALTSSEIPALVRKFQAQCKKPVQMVISETQCEEEVAELTEKMALLNVVIAEMETELDHQGKVVASLQVENSKSKRKLGSCDGNLDAATDILFKTSDRKQIFAEPLSEPLDVIVNVDGSMATASKWIISSSGSMLNSVKYANGSDVDIEATELLIDHQQTLFMPINLGQYFSSLQRLTVTSSGLITLDSRIFNLMQNLKVLNLNSNKLQEIQRGTFDQLKLLTSLDLSSNNLKTLETSVFDGLQSLQVLNLGGNRLITVSPNILAPLKDLQIANLTNNDCINLSYPEETLKEIEEELIKECTKHVEIECFTLGTHFKRDNDIRNENFECIAVDLTIMQPKTRISNLKNKVDMDSFTFSVIDQHIAFLPYQLYKTFTKLHNLVVISSKLTALLQRDFEGLTELKSITIVNNSISLIESGVFDDVPQLEKLDLSSNYIKTLPEMAFVKLAQLKTLNLSDNQLHRFFSELLPLHNVIEEYHLKNNDIEKSNLASSRNLKTVNIIDLTDNICIDYKYDKSEPNSGTLAGLFLALLACSA